jgi:hypothetical protein
VGRPAGGAVRRLTDKMFMQTVHKNVFLLLNSVPVTLVTDPELIRSSISVMKKARKCTAEIVENIQAKIERQHMLVISFSAIPPARSNPQRYIIMCVISPHKSAGMVSLMTRCQIVKLSPAPNDMSEQSELKLYQIDRLARSYGIQKLLRHRDFLKRI